jgi:hypothetical protein
MVIILYESSKVDAVDILDDVQERWVVSSIDMFCLSIAVLGPVFLVLLIILH